MKRTALALALAIFFLLAFAVVVRADINGAWTAGPSEAKSGKLYFSMMRGRHNQNGMTFDLSAFSGLTSAQMNASVSTPVQFELRREAGVVSFEGTFKNGNGAGQFSFAPNRGFENTIRSLGLAFDLERDADDDPDQSLFDLAVFDVSADFIRSMQAIGYKVSLQKFVEFRIFHVTPEYVREMASLGFRDLSAEKLIETRIHKVTPEYIRAMRADGKDLSLDDYVQARIFKVTPEFAAEMAKAGYPNLSQEKLVNFRIHKVTPEFIRDLRELGYDNIPADTLVEMRIFKVTPEFIRELADAGYHNVPIRKMIDMRIHKIDPQMVKRLNDAAH